MVTRQASAPATAEQIAATVAWLEDLDGGQGNLARHAGVTDRTLRKYKRGDTPTSATAPLAKLHEYATASLPAYRHLAASTPMVLVPLVVEPGPAPDPEPPPGPEPPLPVWWRRRRTQVLAGLVVVAVLIGGWLLTRGPTVAVVTPSPGDTVGDGSPLDGQLDGDLPAGWQVWGATLSPAGRYYTQDNPCDVAGDGRVTCDPLYVGRDEASGESWQVCLLVVSDPGALEDYAGRANPLDNNPGLAHPPSATQAQDCVAVVN